MKIFKVRDVKTPTRGTDLSAGIDFYVPNDFNMFWLYPGEDLLIPSGIKAKFDEDLVLIAAEKSGVTTSSSAAARAGRKPKEGAHSSPTVLGAKIVDADYQGEIHIHIINVGTNRVCIKPGDKIAQFILVPVIYDYIEEVTSEKQLYSGEVTQRGAGGFGSTGND